jgi:hypothetical protein
MTPLKLLTCSTCSTLKYTLHTGVLGLRQCHASYFVPNSVPTLVHAAQPTSYLDVADVHTVDLDAPSINIIKSKE